MITPEEIKTILTRSFPSAEIAVEDMTGTYDHFEVRVASAEFADKGLIEQHQMVNKALAGVLEDGRIHALKIKTMKK